MDGVSVGLVVAGGDAFFLGLDEFPLFLGNELDFH